MVPVKALLLSLSLTTFAGVLYALCYPSIFGDGWLPLLFIALPFFLWRLEVAPNLKSTLLHVLAFNLGLNLVGYYWIPHTLREFGELPYPDFSDSRHGLLLYPATSLVVLRSLEEVSSGLSMVL
jgi:apolipoprotein N-acyltransferase